MKAFFCLSLDLSAWPQKPPSQVVVVEVSCHLSLLLSSLVSFLPSPKVGFPTLDLHIFIAASSAEAVLVQG